VHAAGADSRRRNAKLSETLIESAYRQIAGATKAAKLGNLSAALSCGVGDVQRAMQGTPLPGNGYFRLRRLLYGVDALAPVAKAVPRQVRRRPRWLTNREGEEFAVHDHLDRRTSRGADQTSRKATKRGAHHAHKPAGSKPTIKLRKAQRRKR